jgi:hypothetical protein
MRTVLLRPVLLCTRARGKTRRASARLGELRPLITRLGSPRRSLRGACLRVGSSAPEDRGRPRASRPSYPGGRQSYRSCSPPIGWCRRRDRNPKSAPVRRSATWRFGNASVKGGLSVRATSAADGDGRPRHSAECRASRLLSLNLEAVGVDSRNTSILFRCLVAALCSLFPSHLPEVQMLRTKLLQPSKRLGRRKHFPHTLFGISAPAVPLARSIVEIRRGRRRFIVQGLEE